MSFWGRWNQPIFVINFRETEFSANSGLIRLYIGLDSVCRYINQCLRALYIVFTVQIDCYTAFACRYDWEIRLRKSVHFSSTGSSPQIPQCVRQISQNAPFCSRMDTHVHISITKLCIVGYGTGAFWDLCSRSMGSPWPNLSAGSRLPILASSSNLASSPVLTSRMFTQTRTWTRMWHSFHFLFNPVPCIFR